jgi:hypothetical protein
MSKQAYETLAKSGVRLFMLRIHRDPDKIWVHVNKTTEQWRVDVSSFLAKSERSGPDCTDEIFNDLYSHLSDLGYVEADDVVSDVFEGKIESTTASLKPDPDHEEDVTGFGHFGWENGK